MMGSSCCDFAVFASGRNDIHVRFVRKPWDFMPGFLLSTEAGGVYDAGCFEEHRLYVVANSREVLDDFRRQVLDRMDWYREDP